MSTRRRGLMEVAFAAVCFGFLGLFGKMAFAAGLTVGELLTIRFLLATAVLFLFLVLFQRSSLRLSRGQIALSLLLGILGYALFATLYFSAIETLSMALAALLLYTFPLWTVVINALFGARPDRRLITGVTLASVGLLILLWGEFHVQSLRGILCGLGAAVSYAIYIFISSRLQQGVPALGSGVFIMAGAALGLIVKNGFSFEDWLHRGPAHWTPVALIAILGTVFPLTLVQAGLQKLSSTETALLGMLEPVTAAALGITLLHEPFEWHQALGAGVVLISLAGMALRRAAPAV